MPLNFNDIVNRVRGNDPTLTTISLIFNEIGDQGAQALAHSLTTTTSLQKLDLDRNMIGEQGAHSLAQAFKINSSLISLNLSKNKIIPNIFIPISHLIKINMDRQEYQEKIQRKRIYHDLVL